MTKTKWLELKELYTFKKAHWPTIYIILFDLLLIFISWQISFVSTTGLLISSVLFALALLHFYLLLHEATHSAVSHNTNINDIIGQVCGFLILMPYLPRQSSHLLHHTWTGHPKRDPANNRMIQRFSVITKKQVRNLEFLWKYWVPAIIINDRIGLWLAPFQQRKNGLKSQRVHREIKWAYIYFIFYVLTLTCLLWLGIFKHFIAWYLPAVLICFLIEELVNLPHHAETPLLNIDDKALPYWEQYKVTHSCENVAIWSRYILLNFNLHTAHHLFPNAPWYGLRHLHYEISKDIPDLASQQQTTNELRWSLANRKRPLLQIMGHYFDKIPNKETKSF